MLDGRDRDVYLKPDKLVLSGFEEKKAEKTMKCFVLGQDNSERQKEKDKDFFTSAMGLLSWKS